MAGETVYAELTGFGARADKKFVRRKSVVLEGDTTGAGAWVTIASDTYDVDALLGWIEQRAQDDSQSAIDWNYFDYRASYTWVDPSGNAHNESNESITFSEYDGEVIPEAENAEQTGGALYDMFLEGGVSASWGDIGGWRLTDNTLVSGNVTIDSTLEQMTFGAGVGFGSGTGVAIGKSAGVYQFYAGTAGNYIYWNGTTLTVLGTFTATSGTVGGWTINTNYLAKDTGVDATSAGLAPLDYPFYAGATYANRASAPYRVTPSGSVYATAFFTIGSNDLVFNSASDNLLWLKGVSFDRLDVGTTGAFNLDTQGRSWIRLTGTAAKKTISYIKKPANIAGQIIYIKNDANPVTATKTSPLILKNNQQTPPAGYAAMSLFGSDLKVANFGMVTLIYDSANSRWTVAAAVKATQTKTGNPLSPEGYDEGVSVAAALTTGYSATAGNVITTKSAGTLAVDVDIPAAGTWTLEIVTPNDGTTWLFATGDVAYMNNGASGIYFTVAQDTNDGDTQTYTCTYASGTRPLTFYAGAGVVNYGASGQGWLYETAAGGNPLLSARTHAGDPSSFTERARLGALTGITDPTFGALSGYGLWTDNVYLTGAISATSGAIGGWSIASGRLVKDTGVDATSAGLAPTDYPFYAGATYANRASAPYRVTPAGAVTASNITITGGAVATSVLNPALMGWSTDIAFTSTDTDTISWGAGSIRLTNGTTYSIGAGNTGNMGALTYIYLDIAISTVALQTTTTYSTATGDGKILVAVAQNHASNGASVLVYGGGQPIINGGDQITARSIIAGSIATGTITSNEITGTTLSAIRADLGSITAGTITSATIRTASSGARIELNSTKLFGTDGTTTQFEALASTGKLSAGAGTVTLDADGLSIAVGTSTPNKIRWMSGTTAATSIYAYYSAGISNAVWQTSYVNTTDQAQITISASTHASGGGASVTISADKNGAGVSAIFSSGGYLQLWGGLQFYTDNTYDIGGAGIQRPRGISFARNDVTVTSGNQNNKAWGAYSYVKITTASAAFTLTGMSGGNDGHILILVNSSGQNMTLANQNANSDNANRLRCQGGDVATTGAAAAMFIYDGNDLKWDLLSYVA